jgi:hypothetical protein
VAVTQSTTPWVIAGNLTNNNATPAATNLGVLPAIAESAYTNLGYTSGDQVLLVTDLHGGLNTDLQAYAGSQLTGTVTAYGTAPTGNVFGVNAYITNTVPVTLASTTITGTVAVTQSTSPWVVSLASTTITGTVAVDGALTNNNAAPTATLLGVLGAIAETAYNTVTYTTGDMVLPVTDLHGALNQDLQAVAGVQLGATGVTAFGTAPAAVNVPGVNASLFSGVTPLTNTGGSLNVNVTGTVTQSTQGTLTNNNAAPAANNVGVLPAIAETAYNTITYTTGDMVLPVTDLHGALNQDLQAVAGVQLGATAVTAYGTTPAAVNVPAVNAFVTNTVATTNAASATGGMLVATGSIGATKTAVKTSAGQVYGWYFYNSNTSVAYVQFFANTVAGVTLGTTAPTMSFGIPPVAGANVMAALGVQFATGITIAITTTRAGATGPTNTVDYNVFYE